VAPAAGNLRFWTGLLFLSRASVGSLVQYIVEVVDLNEYQATDSDLKVLPSTLLLCSGLAS
jgi:hypothetical protein